MTKPKYYPRIYSCLYCSYATSKGIQFVYKHLWALHREILPYRCSRCLKPFPGVNEVSLHEKYSHKGKRKKKKKTDDIIVSGMILSTAIIYII